MLTARFIRHGESAANAGGATSDPSSIPLTSRGIEQAQQVCAVFQAKIDWIACSPFLRARQTASSTLEQFPSAQLYIWPIHEFTYLSPERCTNTCAEQRRPWVEHYWNTADPLTVDGPGAESFAAFIGRVDALLARLKTMSGSSGAVFGHGQFMQALRWRMTAKDTPITSAAMRTFRTADLAQPIANASGFLASFDGKRWREI
jgi:broad specificity phosphatase PhoE